MAEIVLGRLWSSVTRRFKRTIEVNNLDLRVSADTFHFSVRVRFLSSSRPKDPYPRILAKRDHTLLKWFIDSPFPKSYPYSTTDSFQSQ